MADLARLVECYDLKVVERLGKYGHPEPSLVATPRQRTLQRTNEAFCHILAAHVSNLSDGHGWAVKTRDVFGVSLELAVGDQAEVRDALRVLRHAKRDVEGSAAKVVEGRMFVDRYTPRGY